MGKTEKRTVPPALQALLAADVQATNAFCHFCENFMSMRSLRNHYMLLEISCHGIPWLAGWLAFIWLAQKESLYEMQVNFYIGLLLDIVILAVMKSVVRRRRPTANKPDMFAAVGPDVYSFPSGHATRSVFIATYFIYLFPLSSLTWPPLVAWCSAVSISRILLRRHHLLDVLAGVAVGLLETALVALLWLGPEASAYVVSFLADDKTTYVE